MASDYILTVEIYFKIHHHLRLWQPRRINFFLAIVARPDQVLIPEAFRGVHPIFDLFRKQFSIFIRKNFWPPFFSHWPQIWNPPIFAVSIHFLSHFGKFFFPPTFPNFPPDFVKFTCLLHTFCVFRFPLLWPWCIHIITQCTYWTPLGVICSGQRS